MNLTSNIKYDCELQATLETTGEDGPTIVCYNCARLMTKKHKGWHACENCQNWTCWNCFFNIECGLCNSENASRLAIRTRQKKYVEKMETQYNIRHKERIANFKVSEKVSVSVSKLDRFGTELSRLPGEIISITGDKDIFYEIGTSFGILDVKLRGGDLMPFYGSLNVRTDKKISIREAHRLFCERPKQLIDVSKIFCKCSGKCKPDKRCKCFANNIGCTSHCINHQKKQCVNF